MLCCVELYDFYAAKGVSPNHSPERPPPTKTDTRTSAAMGRFAAISVKPSSNDSMCVNSAHAVSPSLQTSPQYPAALISVSAAIRCLRPVFSHLNGMRPVLAFVA